MASVSAPATRCASSARRRCRLPMAAMPRCSCSTSIPRSIAFPLFFQLLEILMNPSLQNPLALAGRVLLSLMFVLAGFSKIGGVLALMFGFMTRWAALALAVFTVIASLIFHNFWAVPEAQKMVQNLMFMKNLSIAGGLLVLAAIGPGGWSLDARRRVGGLATA